MQKPKELVDTTGLQIAIKRIKPVRVTRMLITHVKDNITSVANASGDCVIVVRCHHRMHTVCDLADGTVLPLDLEGVRSDHRLELVRALVISSPHYFLAENE